MQAKPKSIERKPQGSGKKKDEKKRRQG